MTSYVCRCACGAVFASRYAATRLCPACTGELLWDFGPHGYEEPVSGSEASVLPVTGFEALPASIYDPRLDAFHNAFHEGASFSMVAETYAAWERLLDGLTRKTGRWAPVIALTGIVLLIMALGWIASAGQADLQGWNQ